MASNKSPGSKERRVRRHRRASLPWRNREIPDAFDRDAVVFFDMTEQRLGEALFLLVVETELNGIVTVLAGLGLDLQYAVRAGQHDGDGVQLRPSRHRRASGPVFFLKVLVA